MDRASHNRHVENGKSSFGWGVLAWRIAKLKNKSVETFSATDGSWPVRAEADCSRRQDNAQMLSPSASYGAGEEKERGGPGRGGGGRHQLN